MGLLTPTFTSVATMAGSTYLAVTSTAASQLTSDSDLAILGAAVAASTFVCARLGKAVGKWTGLLGGGTAGAAAGGLLGGGLSEKGERTEGAAAFGLLGGVTLGVALTFAGAAAGFGGGAYLGHTVAKDTTIDYLVKKTAAPVLKAQ